MSELAQNLNENEILPIRLYGDEVLRQVSAPIEEITAEVHRLANDLLASMYSEPNGIGLAAPQIGILRRMFVIDLERENPENKPLILINPEIVHSEGKVTGEEGCLSIPDLRAEVERFEKVTVEAFEITGKKIKMEADGLLSRAIQHELDHLNGVLFIDRLGKVQRQLLRGKLRKLKRQKY